MMDIRTVGPWLATSLAATLLVGCSAPGDSTVPPVANASSSSPTVATATPEPTAGGSTEQSTRNDLETGRASRILKTGAMRVAVEYKLRNKVENWSSGQSQQLTVTMTVLSTSSQDQKVYLSQVTVYQDVYDGRGHVDSPTPLDDRANIVPGYLVNSPAMYTQVFALPPLPGGANRLTLDLRYEMLRLQRGQERDYAKLSITDTIVITKP